MYTDYQTETYFLQDSREMQPSIGNDGAKAPRVTQGSAETSHMVSAMHVPSSSTANNLATNHETKQN